MSLAEAYKDGRELRRLLTGGYEEDVRQQRELKQAAITESRQRTQASKDRIALAQKSEERVRRNQLMMNLYKFKILPELTSMKNRNASQEELDTYSSELSADYPDIMSVFGKDGIHFKKRNRQIEFDITTVLTKENISQYYHPDDPAYSLFMDEIERNGGEMRASISGGEDGTLQIESLKRNFIEKNIGKDIPENTEDIVNLFDSWHPIKNKEEVEDEKGNKISWMQSLKNKSRTQMEEFRDFYHKMNSNSKDFEVKNQSITNSENDIQPAKERKFKVGQIVKTTNGNRKFNGGDPTDPSNWSKI